jgi:hypothetical protein
MMGPNDATRRLGSGIQVCAIFFLKTILIYLYIIGVSAYGTTMECYDGTNRGNDSSGMYRIFFKNLSLFTLSF